MATSTVSGPPDPFQLRKWASMRRPENIAPDTLLEVTEKTIAIKDKYPKAIWHALILPRVREDLSAENLDSLRTLLKLDKDRAKEVLEELGEHAKKIKEEVQHEMRQRYKCEWDVWIGFHAVPSMRHLHLHVISSDLHSVTMKTKKHYNSFHPKHGFFLHYDDVMSWFDAVPSFFKDKASLKHTAYEHILKEDLFCFQCSHSQPIKNMPTLKLHLEKHFKTRHDAAVKVADREKQLKKKQLETSNKPHSKVQAASPVKKRRHEDKESPRKPDSRADDRSSEGSESKRRRTDSPTT